jgi:hypothetical protein
VGRLEADLTRDPTRQMSILAFQRVVITIGEKGGDYEEKKNVKEEATAPD